MMSSLSLLCDPNFCFEGHTMVLISKTRIAVVVLNRFSNVRVTLFQI
jgi:hypothetical protein